jgi:cytochrome P450
MGIEMNHDEISFADPAIQKCPFAAYRTVRSQGNVYRDPRSAMFVVLGNELARKVANDATTFSNETGLLLVKDSKIKSTLDEIWRTEGVMPVSTMVVSDAPAHTFHRSLVGKAFTPVRVREMEAYLESIVDGMIDEFIDRGQVEFQSGMAIRVPLYVIADQLGVPREQWPQFHLWASTVIAQGQHNHDEAEQIRITRTLCELQNYIVARAAEYEAQPRSCILSDLVHARADDGRRLTREELVAIVIQLLTAGYETTAATMTAGLLRIIQTPGLEDLLRKEPARLTNFIEEVLRADAPIQGLFRRATCDTEIGGVPVPAGSLIQLMWGAANRDPAQFEDPDEFQVDRVNARRHVTFGFGPHVCVGNQLARGELRIAFTRLLQRMKNFRLARPHEAIEYISHSFAYGVRALDVAFDRNA